MFGNIFNSLQFPKDKPKEEEEKQTTGLMSSPRPRARPEGMTTSLRPRARPIDDDDDDNTINKTLANTIREINNPAYDDEDGTVTDPRGTPLNSVDAQQVLLDPNSLHSAYNTRMAQAGADFTVKMQKFRSAEVDSALNYAAYTKNQNDEILDKSLASAREALGVPEEVLRPRARPKTVEEIQDIRASQKYTDLDTTRGLQAALNNAGITVNGKPLVEDGRMGPLTEKSIRAFQKREGLEVDGKAGPITKQALYSVAPQPEIREEELQPSIFDKPAQVGPDQMQVGFSADDAASLSTNLAYQEYLRREEDKEQRNAIETSKLITETKDDSAITRPRARPESVIDDIKVTDASILGGIGYGLSSLAGELGLGTAEYRFFANNIINPGGTYTEKDLNSSDKKVLKKAISNAMADNRNYIDYEIDLGVNEMDINKASPLAGIIDPATRMARSIGVFRFSTDKKGNIIIKDTFDFNYGPKRGAFQNAIKRGDRKEALYLLSPMSGTSPVEAASMIGYVKQENLKAKGEPYQTNILINLGKF